MPECGKGELLLKKVFPLMMVAVLFMSVLMPIASKADSKLDKLNQKIQEIERQEQKALKKAKQAAAQIDKINKTTAQIGRDIQELLTHITNTVKKITEINKQIQTTKSKLKETAGFLVEAEERVEQRDALLKTRVRLMYENGSVSYLEVLMGSTSFVDFLDRLDALEMIVEQDQLILEANIRDRNTVAELKQDIEAKLANLSDLFVEAETLKLELVQKEKNKEVMIATLNEEKEHLEEIEDSEQEAAVALAAERQKLMEEREKLKWAGGKFSWPLPDSHRITSNFGMRKHPVTGKMKGHAGVDIGAPKGTKIIAAESGTVIVAQYLRGYGNTVIINHGSGIWTLYAHMSKTTVDQGDSVTKGKTKIGEVGSTGRSTGNHLHFEVRKDEKPVDPMDYLK
jgi:murein DD-endopeptidase MepM/ murein hydrolase activator NlpD